MPVSEGAKEVATRGHQPFSAAAAPMQHSPAQPSAAQQQPQGLLSARDAHLLADGAARRGKAVLATEQQGAARLQLCRKVVVGAAGRQPGHETPIMPRRLHCRAQLLGVAAVCNKSSPPLLAFMAPVCTPIHGDCDGMPSALTAARAEHEAPLQPGQQLPLSGHQSSLEFGKGGGPIAGQVAHQLRAAGGRVRTQ